MLGDRPRVELETVAGTGVEYVLDTQEVPRFTAHFAPLTDGARALARRGLHGAPGGGGRAPGRAPETDPARPRRRRRPSPRRSTRRTRSSIVVGECSAGIMISAVGLVVLTEAEIFGARRRTLRRPKYQRGAALTAFTDLEVNDLVVHEDHGIGRYLGLRTMSVGDRDGDFLLLEYAEGGRLYVPVERLDLVSKYLGGDAGTREARPHGRRLLAAREGVGAGGAARDGRGAAEALRPARGGRGSPLRDRFALAAGVRGVVSLRGDARSAARDRRDQARHGEPAADGPPGGGRRRLRQDRGRAARRVQGGRRRAPGRGAGADDRARAATLVDLHRPLRALPDQGRAALALPHAQGAEGGGGGPAPGHGRRGHRHSPPAVQGRAVQAARTHDHRRGASLRRRPQGAHEAAASLGGRAGADGHADPAHALHGALRRARHVGDRDAAAGPAADRDHGAALQQGRHQGGARARALTHASA